MATPAGTSSLDLRGLEKALPPISSTRQPPSVAPPQELQLKALLWNINGDTSEGMAEARRMLVGEVVKKVNADLLLLQEISAMKTVSHIGDVSLPQRRYVCHLLLKNRSVHEAGIMYDTNMFEYVTQIDISTLTGSNDLSGLMTHRGSRSGDARLTRDQEFYSSRTIAVRLRSKSTRREFIAVSFHNSKSDAAPNTVGFLRLVDLIFEQEKAPVIIGGDFNCDYTGVYNGNYHIPKYTSSRRRRSNKTIDFFMVRPPTVECTVEVFEALPLEDPTSATADIHPLGKPLLRRLTDDAPMRKKEGRRMVWQEFNKVTNHDPTVGTLAIE